MVLHVQGDARVATLLTGTPTRIVAADANGDLYQSTGTNGQVLSWNNGPVWSAASTGTGDVKSCASLTAADNNFVSKWTDAVNKTICKSIIYDDGTNVGIGTTAPISKFMVEASSGAITLNNTNAISSLTNYSAFNFHNVNSGGGGSGGFQIGMYGNSGAATNNAFLWNYFPNGEIFFSTGAGERMRIESDGEVINKFI